MPNVWRWQAKDAKGEIIESAPGSKHFISRGPVKRSGMLKAARILLYSKRQAAVREGLEDPGYEVVEDSVEPVADAPQNAGNVGHWRPANAKPVSVPTDPAVNKAKEKRLADEA